jgi:pSer/pThr/pTyr-binding forkhead associated (FHA) protein
MADAVPVLLGTAGFVLGECIPLTDGADIVIGRSRSCDISLRRAANYLKAPSDTRDVDQDFNTVSRRHLRLQVHESVVRVQDLSTNGTFWNDETVQQARETDLANGPFTLRLGTRETFQVLLLPKDDPRVVAAEAREPQSAGPKTPAP